MGSGDYTEIRAVKDDAAETFENTVETVEKETKVEDDLFALTMFLGFVSVVVTLGGFWYWALIGFSEKVGTALGVTGMLAWTGFICSLTAWGDERHKNRRARDGEA